jgi:MFS family permease
MPLGFQLGPPLLGWLVSAFGTRWSFGFVLPLVVLSWIAALALAPADTAKPAARRSA